MRALVDERDPKQGALCGGGILFHRHGKIHLHEFHGHGLRDRSFGFDAPHRVLGRGIQFQRAAPHGNGGLGLHLFPGVQRILRQRHVGQIDAHILQRQIGHVELRVVAQSIGDRDGVPFPGQQHVRFHADAHHRLNEPFDADGYGQHVSRADGILMGFVLRCEGDSLPCQLEGQIPVEFVLFDAHLFQSEFQNVFGLNSEGFRDKLRLLQEISLKGQIIENVILLQGVFQGEPEEGHVPGLAE